MFQAYREQHAKYCAYKNSVEAHVALLFSGFGDDLLPPLKPRAGHAGLIRQGFGQGTDPRACAVQVAVIQIRQMIGRMGKPQRRDIAQAFLANNRENAAFRGFVYLFQAVERFNVSPALVSYLKTEVAGQLRSMPQKAILGSWVEAQVSGVMGQLRDRCMAEAELKRDLWQ